MLAERVKPERAAARCELCSFGAVAVVFAVRRSAAIAVQCMQQRTA